MICIPEKRIPELVSYFRDNFPEFSSIKNEDLVKCIRKVLIYVPGFIQTHINRKFPDCKHNWTIMQEIITNWAAHIFVLTDAIAVADGAEPLPLDQMRLASSLSEGGLSASFEQAKPSGQTPESIYEYLSKSAYGDNVKMLLEGCLSGAKGVFCV